MNKKAKVRLGIGIILVVAFLFLIPFILSGDGGEPDLVLETIDTGYFNYSYGWNATSQVMTNWDSLSYQTNTNGVLTVKKGEATIGHFGFALTGYIDTEFKIYTSENFTWTWTHDTLGEEHIFTAYNNQANFNWTQVYHFYPDESMKIKHVLTNDYQDITQAKMWYVHTIEEDDIILFNGTAYELNLTQDKHFEGYFDELVPKTEIFHKYFFNYSDIVNSGFNITDVFIGNGSIVGHSDKYILGVGITKGARNFNTGITIEIDPTIETVDSTNDVGLSNSLALDSTGIVHISYIDETNEKLRYCNNTDGTWTCIEMGGVLTKGSSIAIDSNDIPHIAYWQSSYWSLRHTYYNFSSSNWEIEDVSWDDWEMDASIAIDSNDIVHIAYHDGSAGDLKYCNNTGGSWTCQDVDTVGHVGHSASIAIDSNDIVHITHFDLTEDDLRYCNNTGGSWTCQDVDTTLDSAADTSIAIDSTNIVHIAYEHSSDLNYCNNTDGTWTCIEIDGATYTGFNPSIAIGDNDIVHIKCYQSSSPYSIRYCNNSGTWNCKTIDSGSHLFLSDSSNRALAIKKGRIVDSIDFSDYAHMSYQSFAGDLFYAKQILTDINLPLINLDKPINNTNTTSRNLEFNFTVEDEEESTLNCSIYLDGLLNQTNSTVKNDTFTKFSISNIGYGEHNWSIKCSDEINTNTSLNRTFYIIDFSLELKKPESKFYASNLSIPLNYTIVNNTVLDTCWYYVTNNTGIEITNTTLTNCQNTTLNVSGENNNFTLYLYVNETRANLELWDAVTFGVSLTTPAVVLDYPENDTWLNNKTVYFNFTATDLDGLSTCELWGNWTTAWHKNYTWVHPTNDTQNFTIVNISDGNYVWNIWCNDTTVITGSWALNNRTVKIDATLPNAQINLANNTYFTSLTATVGYGVSDDNIEQCNYSLYDISTGLIASGFNENETLNCSETSLELITSSAGQYWLRVYAEDLAGNINTRGVTFNTQAGGGDGTGGGGGSELIEVEAPSECGDGVCQTGENIQNCPIDCVICGDGVCSKEHGEDVLNCPRDCQTDIDKYVLNCFECPLSWLFPTEERKAKCAQCALGNYAFYIPIGMLLVLVLLLGYRQYQTTKKKKKEKAKWREWLGI